MLLERVEGAGIHAGIGAELIDFVGAEEPFCVVSLLKDLAHVAGYGRLAVQPTHLGAPRESCNVLWRVLVHA